MRLNFSNEGGIAGTTRFLKNVMGLWMLQSCRRQWSQSGLTLDYCRVDGLGRERGARFRHLVDPDEASFVAPDSMTDAIDRFCARTDQPAPASPGAYARTILDSLALKYRLVIRDLETVTGQRISAIRVIGGGSRNRVLNQFTADATGRRVIAGPVEATAIGNIAVQLLATGATASLAEARALIDRSFPTDVFEPGNREPWDREAARGSSNIAKLRMPETISLQHLEDLWDPSVAGPLESNQLSLLRYRSNLLGADLRITNFGGGNTSAKIELPDPFTGAPARVLAVKGSGGDLGSIADSGFALLYLDRLEQLKRRYRGEAHEDEMVELLPAVGLRPEPCRGFDRHAAARVHSRPRMSITCIRTGQLRWPPARTASGSWTSSTPASTGGLSGFHGSGPASSSR